MKSPEFSIAIDVQAWGIGIYWRFNGVSRDDPLGKRAATAFQILCVFLILKWERS